MWVFVGFHYCVEMDSNKRARSMSPDNKVDKEEPSSKKPSWYVDINDDFFTVDEITEILLGELNHVLDEEYEQELAKLPKVEKKVPVTQAEKCAEGMHGRIVDGERGETCSACGKVVFYWFLKP